jgi:hypothetical protein
MKTVIQTIILGLIVMYSIGAISDALDYEYNKALDTGIKYSQQKGTK